MAQDHVYKKVLADMFKTLPALRNTMMNNEQHWYAAVLIVLIITLLLPYLYPRPPQELTTIPQNINTQLRALGTNSNLTPVIVFSDLESPIDSEYAQLIEALSKAPINFVYVPLPSQQHINAQIAAVLLECMRNQNLYYETVQAFTRIQTLDQQRMINALATVGNATQAWACAKSGEKEPTIEQYMTWASQIHIISTPTFFKNDIQVSEPYTYQRLTEEQS